MDSTNPTIAVLPLDLGDAALIDQNIFPLAYYDCGDNLSKGRILLRATLAEMKKIKELGIDLNKNEDFIFNTRLELEVLREKGGSLDRKTFNPFKALLNYRATQLFLAASKSLYIRTKRTTEKIQREEKPIQVVPGTQVRMVNDAIPPDAKISGFAVELPDGLDDIAQQTINDATQTMITTDPFGDRHRIPQPGDDEQAMSLLGQDVGDSEVDRPTSPVAINHIHIYHSIFTTNSNLTGVTLNRGTRNSGASVT